MKDSTSNICKDCKSFIIQNTTKTVGTCSLKKSQMNKHAIACEKFSPK